MAKVLKSVPTVMKSVPKVLQKVAKAQPTGTKQALRKDRKTTIKDMGTVAGLPKAIGYFKCHNIFVLERIMFHKLINQSVN